MEVDLGNDRETQETDSVAELTPSHDVTLEAGERKAALLVIAGPRVGQMRKVERDEEVEIGREPTSDLQVPDPGISRSHARVEKPDEDSVRIEDLDSSNGTFVNGDEIDRPVALEHGDKITMGTSTVLKFAYQDPVEETFQQKMYEATLRDELTDAYNKHFLYDHLQSEISYARRHETDLSLVLFDLDHFKELNDTYGHVAGDAVLREVADLVRASIRKEDMFARYGGEEFAVVLRGVGTVGSETMAERIRQQIDEHAFEFEGQSLETTISVGVVTLRETDVTEVEDLIEAADEALYKAKEDGRNCVRFVH